MFAPLYALVVAAPMIGLSVTPNMVSRDQCEQIGKAAVALIVKQHRGHADYVCTEVK